MKKLGLIILSAIVIFSIVGVVFKDNIVQVLYDTVTADMFVSQDEDDFDVGPNIGSQLPAIKALYNGSEITDLSALSGQKGSILIASRSVDWCPFCMRQLIELEANKADFDQAGIQLIVMTYDKPALQQAFSRENNISIPLLSDINASSFGALGILNTDYQQGDENYGLPFPGSIIIDNNGKIVGKLFVEAYSSRVDAKSTLQYALTVLP